MENKEQTEAQIAKTNDETYLNYPSQLQSEEVNEEFEKTRAEIEKRFNELLTTISEETIQLSEYLLEEKKLIRELCMFLRQILRRLNMTFNISVKAVPELQNTAKKIVLNKEGHLIIMYEKEKVSSKVLEDYPPEVVLTVIWCVIPELEKSIKTYRRKISERVSIFERIKKELKKIGQVFSSSEHERSGVFIVGNEELKSPISENKAQNTPSEGA
jgi:F0F1-type ATP synthase membrane subunit b/b'